MKRFRNVNIRIIILVLLIWGLAGCKKTEEMPSDNEASMAEDVSLETLSETLALQMAEGDFDETYRRCSAAVKLQLTKNALKQAWDVTVNGMGGYIDIYEILQKEAEGYQIVEVILRYENNGLKVSFTYNDSGKIDGLWINYSPVEAEAVSTEEYEEIKITFGEGEHPVTGILTLPKGTADPPAVILVPGSGSHDADETVGANKPFRDIARGLAELGVASLRYNERIFLYPELAEADITIHTDSLWDAADAVSYALNCDRIDTDNIFVIGHSLGGMMAPKLAYDHSEIAGIILLAGSPRKLEDIIYDQTLDAVENAAGITEEQAAEALKETEEGMLQIRSLTEDSGDIILGMPASYWYSLNQIDTASIAGELTIPVYIAQGSEDWQVYPDKDFKQWQQQLAGKENVTFKLYDNLNHLFMSSNGKRDITEYNIPGSVDQAVIDDIAAWIEKNR